jgi:hypothetical protein
MHPEIDNPTIVICADKDAYLKNDIGGAVYELPSQEFVMSPQKGLSEYEMVSTGPIKPLKKYTYPKSTDAMLSVDIKVRFTDKQTFDSLLGNPKQMYLVKRLESYTK